MKIVISIPDEVVDAAERLAGRRGMSRSELYSRAVADRVERHRDDRVTEALDAVYGAERPCAAIDPNVQSLQVRSVWRR